MVEVLRGIIQALKDIMGKAPSAGLLMEKYTRMCLVVDEVINEVGSMMRGRDSEACHRSKKGPH